VRLRFTARKFGVGECEGAGLMLRAAQHASGNKGREIDDGADGRQQQRPVVKFTMIDVVKQKQRQFHLGGIR
jgi:hypothetical protein